MRTLDTPNPLKDIPLAHAMVAWTPKRDSSQHFRPGAIQIIEHPDERDSCQRLGLSCALAACCYPWGGMDTAWQLKELLAIGWLVIFDDGLDPQAVHQAFLVIPEYRAFCEAGYSIERSDFDEKN